MPFIALAYSGPFHKFQYIFFGVSKGLQLCSEPADTCISGISLHFVTQSLLTDPYPALPYDPYPDHCVVNGPKYL